MIIDVTYFFLIKRTVHRAVINIQGAPTVAVAQDTKERKFNCLAKGYLPIIFGRPFLLSEDVIVLPFTSLLIALPTLSLKPFGGLSLTTF